LGQRFRLPRRNEKIDVMDDIGIAHCVQHVIEGTEIVHHAILLEQAYGVFSAHVVRVFIAFRQNVLNFTVSGMRFPPFLD
jgi:hypothetical protein